MRKLVNCFLALIVAAAVFGPAAAGDLDADIANENVYLHQLRQDNPDVDAQYRDLIEPIKAEHDWVGNGGTESPVGIITIDQQDYVVTSSCKPHDCPSERLVTLLTPNADQAAGALTVNHGDTGLGPQSSTITWLGSPNRSQRRYLAAYLFN